MIAPDVNVLIYAHRTDEPRYRLYRLWFEDLVNGSGPFALSTLVAVAFVRIVTYSKSYPDPTPLATALAVIDELTARPNCRLIGPAHDHWQRVAELCRATGATGKLVADAQHAAVAMAEGCTWVSNDRDFAKFAPHGLSWRHLVLS